MNEFVLFYFVILYHRYPRSENFEIEKPYIIYPLSLFTRSSDSLKCLNSALNYRIIDIIFKGFLSKNFPLEKYISDTSTLWNISCK